MLVPFTLELLLHAGLPAEQRQQNNEALLLAREARLPTQAAGHAGRLFAKFVAVSYGCFTDQISPRAGPKCSAELTDALWRCSDMTEQPPTTQHAVKCTSRRFRRNTRTSHRFLAATPGIIGRQAGQITLQHVFTPCGVVGGASAIDTPPPAASPARRSKLGQFHDSRRHISDPARLAEQASPPLRARRRSFQLRHSG